MGMIMNNRGQGLWTVLRITAEAAAAFFITAAILDAGVGMTRIGRYLESLQLMPAAFTLGLSTIAIWIGISLIFGRIYCSTVCPLGALMDLSARFRPAKRRYRFSRPAEWIRTFFLGLFIPLAVLATVPRQWIEPFGIYSEIVSHIRHPHISLGALTALALFAAIAITAWRRGRLICETLCPVGTMLGVIARQSAIRIDINTDRCIQCRRCVDVCKAECIDIESHVADMSRCVVCFNCLPVCPNEAITYTARRHTLSLPMMQPLKPTTQTQICDNTSTYSPTSSTTAPSNQTAPAPAPSASSADRCGLTSAKDFRC